MQLEIECGTQVKSPNEHCLFFQRRIANMYFVVTLVLTYVIDSQVDGTSWLMSLLFVLVVTMIKQAYEDYLRHQNDK